MDEHKLFSYTKEGLKYVFVCSCGWAAEETYLLFATKKFQKHIKQCKKGEYHGE